MRVLVAGGGTGGHLYPAIAIVEEIHAMAPDAEFLFVGTKGKIEARVVPQRGYPFETIWISGFHRSLRPANLLFPLKVVVSVVQSFFLIRHFRPDVAVGTGGYVCGPLLTVASWLGVPVVLHESNSHPGVTVRMLAKKAAVVLTAFEETRKWLPPAVKMEVVGTPVRASLGTASHADGARAFGLDPAKPVVLIFGGSLGAASINQAVRTGILAGAQSHGYQIIWQTGRTIGSIPENARSAAWVGPFIEEMEKAYAAADVVVCRSGATTIAELTRLGKAAILVPYPHAAADHQTANARTLSEAGAAVLLPDAEVGKRLEKEVADLLANKARREEMEKAGRKLGKPDAARAAAVKILDIVRHSNATKSIQI